jgi:hypothetical protein
MINQHWKDFVMDLNLSNNAYEISIQSSWSRNRAANISNVSGIINIYQYIS